MKRTYSLLRKHGVYIDARLYHEDTRDATSEDDDLPEYVDDVRQTLLDFCLANIPEHLVQAMIKISEEDIQTLGRQDVKVQDNPCFAIPKDATVHDIAGARSSVHNIERVDNFHTSARNLRMRLNRSEANVRKLIEREIFHDSDTVKNTPGSNQYHASGWEVFNETLWNEEFPCFEQEPKVPDSQPDLTYGLRMSKPGEELSPGSSNWMPMRNLNPKFLSDLRHEDLKIQTSVTSKLSTQEIDKFVKEKDHHFICFPFAVVEFKQPGAQRRDIEDCYCQVACAAARAISQRIALDRAYAGHKTRQDGAMLHNQNMSPFIGYTCIGSAAKVWLAYTKPQSATGTTRITMKCIWSTSILVPWGVCSLQLIVKNMHAWAIEDFRSKTVHKLEILRQRQAATLVQRTVDAEISRSTSLHYNDAVQTERSAKGRDSGYLERPVHQSQGDGERSFTARRSGDAKDIAPRPEALSTTDRRQNQASEDLSTIFSFSGQSQQQAAAVPFTFRGLTGAKHKSTWKTGPNSSSTPGSKGPSGPQRQSTFSSVVSSSSVQSAFKSGSAKFRRIFSGKHEYLSNTDRTTTTVGEASTPDLPVPTAQQPRAKPRYAGVSRLGQRIIVRLPGHTRKAVGHPARSPTASDSASLPYRGPMRPSCTAESHKEPVSTDTPPLLSETTNRSDALDKTVASEDPCDAGSSDWSAASSYEDFTIHNLSNALTDSETDETYAHSKSSNDSDDSGLESMSSEISDSETEDVIAFNARHGTCSGYAASSDPSTASSYENFTVHDPLDALTDPDNRTYEQSDASNDSGDGSNSSNDSDASSLDSVSSDISDAETEDVTAFDARHGLVR